MRFIEKLRMRFRSLIFRSRVDDELDDEIRFHLEQQIQEQRDRGASSDEALVIALRELGIPERIKEECRDMRKVDYIENLGQDIGYGLRLIIKRPGFAAVAKLTLGLGVGANTAIFSLVNGILLRPLPYSQPDRLVRLTEYYPKGAYVILRDQSQTMEVAACAAGEELNLVRTGAPPIRLTGTIVSANFFSMLGARAELGRLFQAGEDTPGNNQVVILSHSMWQSEFGGAPGIIGRRITLVGVSREVVGVMPADLSFASNQASLWVQLSLDPR